MRFRILGPLEVCGDEPVVIGAAKHRAVLGTLLLGANRVQSVDRLIDTVWGDRPPATARNLVSVYVHHLRRLVDRIGMDSTEVIVTRPPGYLLRVSTAELDYLLFQRIVAAGRTAAAEGDNAEAARLFGEALALWRGPALSDVDMRLVAGGERSSLEELRLGVLEDRVDADLRLGGHHRLVAELESLVAQHPFRERLHGQLVLALYRSSRRGDAVRAYQRARQTLVGELGVEPGPELQALVRAVLQDDTALAGRPRLPRAVRQPGTHARTGPPRAASHAVVVAPGGGGLR
jgi:DNA-binding SARP family transcriptional activator